MQRLENVYLPVLLVAFLHTAATAAIATAEAIYLRHGLGASYSLIGSVLGASAVAYLIFNPYLKAIPKLIGKGTYLLWTSLVLSLAAVLAANISNAGMYLASKTLLLLLAPITFGVLIELIEEEFRFARNKDALLFTATLTAAIGGIAGFLTGGHFASIQYGHAYIFATAAFITAGMTSLLLPSNKQRHRNKRIEISIVDRLAHCFDEKHRTLTWIVLATNAYWAIRDFTIPLLLYDMGYGPAAIGVLLSIGAASGVASMFITRHLLNKNHPERVITAALLLAAAASLILPFGGLILIGISYALYVAGDVALTPSISDRVEETAASNLAAPFITSLGTAAAMAWIIAPWIAGVVLEAGMSLRVILFCAGALIALVYEIARRKYLGKELFFPRLSMKQNKKHLIWR